jgi:flagellar biosynthesis protein FlhA
MATVHAALSRLLAERVPIRDLRTIITALLSAAPVSQDPRVLLDAVRAKLGGFIVQDAFGAVDELKVMALDPELERLLQDALKLAASNGRVAIEPSLAVRMRSAAADAAARLAPQSPTVGLVTQPELRELAAALLHPVRPRICVLSYAEIPDDKRIKVVETLGRPVEQHAQG